MNKFIAILFIGLLWNHSIHAQLIDSLQKVLPSLKDTARVDCLQELSVQYLFKPDEDSAMYFANLAYNESKKINYVNGIAQSFAPRAAVRNHFHNDFSGMEQLARESLKWFGRTDNKKGIEISYWQVGASLYTQGKYDDALVHLNLSYEVATKAGSQFANNALEQMTDVYRERGDYVKLLETQQKIIKFERESGETKIYTFHELWVMGLMYMLLDEYSTALPFWRQLFLVESEYKFGSTWNLTEYAQLLTMSNQTDSALFYYNQFDSVNADVKDLRYFLVSKGEYYIAKKEYTKALANFQQGLIYHRQLNDLNQTKRTLLDIAKCYEVLMFNDSAIMYALQGLSIAIQTKSKPYIRDGYEILYSIYNRLQQTDSAYYYYHNYIDMKEAVMNAQTRGKLAAYKYEHQIQLLDKEKELHVAKLQRESLQKKILIAGVLAALLLGAFIFRNIILKRRTEKNQRKIAENDLQLQKLEYEKSKVELQKQATELEMQALRAQMNPHFIFNSLNSVNRFILQNNKEQASEYLTKFSKLVRMILQNSQASLITLESELESLELYLDLEALRFNHHFTYKVKLSNDIDAEMLKVPPLIIQPYVENSIWHGLMHKEEKGQLDIEINMENNFLFIKITDDGIGRKQAAAHNSKYATNHKSVGLKITGERIAKIQGLHASESPVIINDLIYADGSAAGTEVIIKIPCLYDKSDFD
jgi:hypothetical protein